MRRPTTSGRLLALLLATSLLAAACGGRDEADDPPAGGNGGDDTPGEVTDGDFMNAEEDCPADWSATTGVEGDTIKVGTIRPSTGAVTVTIYQRVTNGMKAHFQSINDAGGVTAGDGKKYFIELVEKDDSYDPAKTPAAAEDLIERENVFAMVAGIGTETNLAIRDYVNTNCVPSIGLGTGSPEWGKNNTSPWYVGGLPSYATEAVAFLDYYKTVKPDASIAVLYQNDDFGQSYKAAIEKYVAADDVDMTVAGTEPFDVTSGQTPEAGVTRLAQTQADVLFVGVSGSSCAGSLTFIPDNWTPDRYLSITCSGKVALSFGGDKVDGLFTSQATLVPDSAADREHPRMQDFISKATAAGLTQDEIEDGIHAAGWGFAAIFLKALELTPEVTRDSLMNTIWQLDIDEPYGLLRDGQVIKTETTDDPWIIEGLRIVQRQNDDWTEVSPLQDYNGRSNDLAG